MMRLVRSRTAHATLFLLLLAAAQAQENSPPGSAYEGREVVTIQFIPAEQPLEASELHDILPLKARQPLRMNDVRASIERLFATGRYKDIQVDAQLYTEKGVIIRFLTANSWFIGNVAISGNLSDPPNAGQLENATRLNLGEPFTDEKVKLA